MLWFPGFDDKKLREPSLDTKAGHPQIPGHMDHHWAFVLYPGSHGEPEYHLFQAILKVQNIDTEVKCLTLRSLYAS